MHKTARFDVKNGGCSRLFLNLENLVQQAYIPSKTRVNLGNICPPVVDEYYHMLINIRWEVLSQFDHKNRPYPGILRDLWAGCHSRAHENTSAGERYVCLIWVTFRNQLVPQNFPIYRAKNWPTPLAPRRVGNVEE